MARFKEEVAAGLLAGGASVSEAAKAAGCSAKTVRRMMARPEFVDRVAAIRRERLDRAMARTESLLLQSANRLAELIASVNDAVAVGAVKAVSGLLASVSTLTEIQDLRRRVSEIERNAKEGSP